MLVSENFARWSRTLNSPVLFKFVGHPHESDRGFTNHEHLDHLGLIHMNGRVYNPIIGRFISPDPYIPQPYNGQSHNRYSYVLNNPLRYTDPTGYSPQDEMVVIGSRNPSLDLAGSTAVSAAMTACTSPRQ